MTKNESYPKIEAQINQLHRRIDEFAACIEALPEGAFLQKIKIQWLRSVMTMFIILPKSQRGLDPAR